MYRTAIPCMYACVCVFDTICGIHTLDGEGVETLYTMYTVGGVTRLKIAADKFEFA